ncbi:unnamed protein product, partial [Tilletia controversa]
SMRLATLSFLAAIFTAAVADGLVVAVGVDHEPKHSAGWDGCVRFMKCRDGTTVASQNLMHCMYQHWAGLSNDEKCPYPEVGCHCYNGCVAEMWSAERAERYDYGADCRYWCLGGTKQPAKC